VETTLGVDSGTLEAGVSGVEEFSELLHPISKKPNAVIKNPYFFIIKQK
jgi:hypothetical protein